jgi:hypothetical protein
MFYFYYYNKNKKDGESYYFLEIIFYVHTHVNNMIMLRKNKWKNKWKGRKKMEIRSEYNMHSYFIGNTIKYEFHK